VTEFARRLALSKAIVDSTDLIEQGRFDAVEERIRAALLVGSKADVGLDYFASVRERLLFGERQCIPTGIRNLDMILRGGFALGELATVLGATGGGKSMALVGFGRSALAYGRDVVEYTLELSENEVATRYDSSISGAPYGRTTENFALVTNKVDKFHKLSGGAKFFIKEYPTKTASVADIRAHLRSIQAFMKPQLIIIDYADVLKVAGAHDKKYEALQDIYEELRGLAMEFDVAVVTACLSGDTEVCTLEGDIPIKALVGKNPWVFASDESGRKNLVKAKNVRSTGFAPVYRIELDNGSSLKATGWHPFMMRDGSYKKVEELQVGDSLMPFRRYTDPFGYRFVETTLDNSDPSRLKYEHSLAFKTKGENIDPDSEVVHHVNFVKGDNRPENLVKMTRIEHTAYHRKLGKRKPTFAERRRLSIFQKEHNSMYVPGAREKMRRTLKANPPIQFVSEDGRERMRLAVCGPKNWRFQNRGRSYIEVFGEEKARSTKEKIGSHSRKVWEGSSESERYSRLRGLREYNERRQVNNHKVVKIELLGVEEVFDMEVPGFHNFSLAAGVVVHNSQVNRESLTRVWIDIDNVSESFGKIMVSDVVIAINQTHEERDANRARLAVVKNRTGPLGSFNIRTNFAKAVFASAEEVTDEFELPTRR
jgi:replicative DNA helicase